MHQPAKSTLIFSILVGFGDPDKDILSGTDILTTDVDIYTIL